MSDFKFRMKRSSNPGEEPLSHEEKAFSNKALNEIEAVTDRIIQNFASGLGVDRDSQRIASLYLEATTDDINGDNDIAKRLIDVLESADVRKILSTISAVVAASTAHSVAETGSKVSTGEFIQRNSFAAIMMGYMLGRGMGT